MENGSKRKYSDGHLWVEVHGDEAILGLTQLAIEELGNVTFVELPKRGLSVRKDDVLFVLEAEKASGDFVAPLDCVVADCNDTLASDTTPVNSSPEQAGWICKVTVKDKSQLENLMDEKEYLNEFGRQES